MVMNLNLSLSQKLVMTQSMQQSIEILQMSHDELVDFLNDFSNNHPLLDIQFSSPYQGGKNACGTEDALLNYPDHHYCGLSSYLKDQLVFLNLPKHLHDTAVSILSYINDIGYIDYSMEELANLVKKSPQKVEKALKVIQCFDPTGVGARNLQECVLIQLKKLNMLSPLMETFVKNLHHLENYDLHYVSKHIGLSYEFCKKALHDIRIYCCPKPGLSFSGFNPLLFQMPDLIMLKQDNIYTVSLNADAIPSIVLKSISLEDHYAQSYMKQQNAAGQWLIQSLKHRYEKILKVGKKIIDIQKSFFDHGPQALKPMSIKILAQDLDMHPSTISRITSQKFIKTPKGTFPLKFFFTHTLSNDDDLHISNKGIMDIMKKIIDGEPSERPYSDEQIMRMLENRGIKIARRTVTKYRKNLNIDSSQQRRLDDLA
jgi:RNA polymerase sigma-54 factor